MQGFSPHRLSDISDTAPSTGLILQRVADPDLKTPAYQAFGYKQLILEPFFGGGLVTAGAIPVIANFGAGALFAGMLALFLGALAWACSASAAAAPRPRPRSR